MVNTCCVNGCTARSSMQSARNFYRIPKIDTTQGTKIVELTQKRRRAWLQQINRKTVTELMVKSWTRVCSKHFLSGKFVIYPSLKWKLCLCRLTRVELFRSTVGVSVIHKFMMYYIPSTMFRGTSIFLVSAPLSSLIVDRQTFFRVYHPKHQSVLSVNDKTSHWLGGRGRTGFETQMWQTSCVDEQLLLVHLIFIVCIVWTSTVFIYLLLHDLKSLI